ncbi:MAG: hypothetical protein BVN30_11585 [Proteobacteria bacterium ST_bin16]|nr:MAG: hypothetical protein BVN30_11585 [Proteobacteria bacterium ST_bin16]
MIAHFGAPFYRLKNALYHTLSDPLRLNLNIMMVKKIAFLLAKRNIMTATRKIAYTHPMERV